MVKIIVTFISKDIENILRYDIPLDNYDISDMRIFMLIEDMEEWFHSKD